MHLSLDNLMSTVTRTFLGLGRSPAVNDSTPSLPHASGDQRPALATITEPPGSMSESTETAPVELQPSGCQCFHADDFPEPPSDAVLCSIIRGAVTSRAHVEKLLGAPSYARCERCPGHDVEYCFEKDGTVVFPVLAITYGNDDAVVSIAAHTSPMAGGTARQSHPST